MPCMSNYEETPQDRLKKTLLGQTCCKLFDKLETEYPKVFDQVVKNNKEIYEVYLQHRFDDIVRIRKGCKVDLTEFTDEEVWKMYSNGVISDE